MTKIERKRNLRGREERISEDMTCKKRKIKWRLREISRIKEREGIKYG